MINFAWVIFGAIQAILIVVMLVAGILFGWAMKESYDNQKRKGNEA